MAFDRKIKNDDELMRHLKNITHMKITPIKDPLAGVNNGKELIRAQACVRNATQYLNDRFKNLDAEMKVIQEKIKVGMPTQEEWDKLRKTLAEFGKKINTSQKG
jgi:S-adenosylmethionine synthetase